jgi:hypothetical protein
MEELKNEMEMLLLNDPRINSLALASNGKKICLQIASAVGDSNNRS